MISIKPLKFGAEGINPTGKLSFQTESIDNGPIAIDIFVFDIIQQPAASADKHQQSSAGVMIFCVNL